jgi:CHAT domain-containing protein
MLPPEVNELLISADGVLHSLPFPALREQPGGPPLGARFALVSTPSARLWAHWVGQKRGTAPGRLLVLADPTVSQEIPAGWPVVAAQRAGRLAPLPSAREEGEWLAKRFDGHADLHVGADAREQMLKLADLGRYGVLHFAAHAIADEAEPDRSAVVLAPGAGDDGFLRPSEIEALRLDHAVVVLSACQGASGQAVGGEGVFSLSRSFLKAGADAVIASLWPLRDDDALWFFRAFYRNLAGGNTLGGALQATRRQAVDAGMPARAWAGIVLIGDSSLAPTLRANAEEPSPRL